MNKQQIERILKAAISSQEDGFNQANIDVDQLIELCLKALERKNELLDSERIDWLADRDNVIGNVQLPSACVEHNLTSLRDAIDEAMKL